VACHGPCVLAGSAERWPSLAGVAPAAAFFDLDRTLMAGSSAFAFAREAYRSGLMSRRQIVADGLANVAFRLQGSTDQSTDALRDRAGAALAGIQVRDIRRMGPGILGDILPRVYPQMLQEAWRHQDEGRRVYIVTAASQEMAELVAGVLLFDGALGSGWEKEDGAYTGRAIEPFTYRVGKAEAMRGLAAREGYDLEASYAYSDSESDLPMLRAVGNPVAVNPDRALERVARAEGWRIMRFERLRRRLFVAAGAVAALALGSASRAAVQRRRRPARGLTRVPLAGRR
jgi:HAD superfamily hydrolase (TIGR01490 family)